MDEMRIPIYLYTKSNIKYYIKMVKKEIKKFDVQNLKERQDTAVTLKFNEKIYSEFKKIMREQGLRASSVLNQFMKLTNQLLKEGSGEVCFIFKENKKIGGKKR